MRFGLITPGVTLNPPARDVVGRYEQVTDRPAGEPADGGQGVPAGGHDVVALVGRAGDLVQQGHQR